MIDTAGTLCAAGKAVMDAGAVEVYAAATHAVFSGNAYANLDNSPFVEVIVTDTIPLRDGGHSKVKVLSCALLLADSIRRIFTSDSVSDIFRGQNQIF